MDGLYGITSDDGQAGLDEAHAVQVALCSLGELFCEVRNVVGRGHCQALSTKK